MLDAAAARRRARPSRTRRCRRRRTRPAPSSPGARSSARRRARRSRGRPSGRAARPAITPAPTTTASAASSSPPRVITFATRPSPSKRSSSSPPWTLTPCDSSSSWKKRPARAPKPRSSVDLLLHHDRAALAQQRQRRGDLAGDVGAADQHHLLGVRHAVADRVGVAERAQVVDLLELAAADVQPAHVGAGGDQRLVELDLLLVRELRRARLQVETPVTLVRVSSSMSCSDHHSFGRKSGSSRVSSPRR